MEGAPRTNNEAFDTSDTDVESAEQIGDELQYELAKEAGHIVVNPLGEDHDFIASNDDEDDENDNL